MAYLNSTHQIFPSRFPEVVDIAIRTDQEDPKNSMPCILPKDTLKAKAEPIDQQFRHPPSMKLDMQKRAQALPNSICKSTGLASKTVFAMLKKLRIAREPEKAPQDPVENISSFVEGPILFLRSSDIAKIVKT